MRPHLRVAKLFPKRNRCKLKPEDANSAKTGPIQQKGPFSDLRILHYGAANSRRRADLSSEPHTRRRRTLHTHTHTHARTHARTHAHTHARTYAHTHDAGAHCKCVRAHTHTHTRRADLGSEPDGRHPVLDARLRHRRGAVTVIHAFGHGHARGAWSRSWHGHGHGAVTVMHPLARLRAQARTHARLRDRRHTNHEECIMMASVNTSWIRPNHEE
jgi:hypothetical protein